MVLEGTNDLVFGSDKRQFIARDTATTLVFDPPSGAVFAGIHTYLMVTAQRSSNVTSPEVETLSIEPGQSSTSRIDVASMEPDLVAELLERHAEHVRTGLRVSLAHPGKASAIALIASMMKHRSDQGLLRPTLAEEADWLATWAMTAAPSYFVPGVKGIKNKLSGLYRDLTQGGPRQPGGRP